MTDPLPWRRYNNYARESARFNSQTLQTYILQRADKERESFQTCSKVCLFFSHSEVQVPQGYPAPQVRPPWAISEADPTCKGLTCFSKTQNERKVSVNFTAYDDWPPSLKQKPQLCTRKCHFQTAMKVTGQKLPKTNNIDRSLFYVGLRFVSDHGPWRVWEKKWTIWLSGQKLNKIANAPGHLGFFEVSSQIHIMSFPWTMYMPQPMSVIRSYCCIFEKNVFFFPQKKDMFLAERFLYILASFEQELQTWQEQLKKWDPFERRKKKEQNMNANWNKQVIPFAPFLVSHVFF